MYQVQAPSTLLVGNLEMPDEIVWSWYDPMTVSIIYSKGCVKNCGIAAGVKIA